MYSTFYSEHTCRYTEICTQVYGSYFFCFETFLISIIILLAAQALMVISMIKTKFKLIKIQQSSQITAFQVLAIFSYSKIPWTNWGGWLHNEPSIKVKTQSFHIFIGKLNITDLSSHNFLPKAALLFNSRRYFHHFLMCWLFLNCFFKNNFCSLFLDAWVKIHHNFVTNSKLFLSW